MIVKTAPVMYLISGQLLACRKVAAFLVHFKEAVRNVVLETLVPV